MKTAKHVIITLITLLFPVLILTSPVRAQESTPDASILEFTGKKQLVLGEADIDYLTGRATNTVKKGETLASSQESQPQQTSPSSSTVVTEPAPQVSETPAPAPTEDRMVYVTGGGKSKVYWYGTEQMPKNTNKNNLITMPESQAIAEGRRHSKTDH